MTTTADAATLNGVTLSSNFFYAVSASSISSSGVNGTNTYSGQVATGGQASFAGTIANTSSGGNGSFSLTSATGAKSYFLVLGSSSDQQNLVIQQYDPTTGATSGMYVIANSGAMPAGSVSFASANGYAQPTCFLVGTLILTDCGEVPVEKLRVGDRVTTADGTQRPIRWIGHQTYDASTYIRPDHIWPVLVEKDAIAPNQPLRDVYLTGGHAVVVGTDEPIMTPVNQLINGRTIRQVQKEVLSYWHLELDSHDAVFANGLLSETYLDVGNRASFETVAVAEGFLTNDVRDRQDSRFPCHMNDAVAASFRERLTRRADALIGAANLLDRAA